VRQSVGVVRAVPVCVLERVRAHVRAGAHRAAGDAVSVARLLPVPLDEQHVQVLQSRRRRQLRGGRRLLSVELCERRRLDTVRRRVEGAHTAAAHQRKLLERDVSGLFLGVS
jgi:hypothetical protein